MYAFNSIVQPVINSNISNRTYTIINERNIYTYALAFYLVVSNYTGRNNFEQFTIRNG